MRSLHAVLAVSLTALSLTAACEGATSRVDVRYSTPEHTVATLFTAYGLEDLSQQQVRERMASHGRFELRDRDSYLACFADLRSPADEGLAGFVLGALAAGKDELRTSIAGDRAVVSPRPGFDVVLHPDEEGRWRISLDETVPVEVRARMGLLAADYEHRQRRGQATR